MSGELHSVLTFESDKRDDTPGKSQADEAAAAYEIHESLRESAAFMSAAVDDNDARQSRASLTPLPSPSDPHINLSEEGNWHVRKDSTDSFLSQRSNQSNRSNRSKAKSLPPSSSSTSNLDLGAMAGNDILDHGHVHDDSTDSFHLQRNKIKSLPPTRRDRGGFFHASNSASALRQPLLGDGDMLSPSDTIFSYRQMPIQRNGLPSMRPEYMRKIGKQPESHDIKDFESAVQKDFERSLTKV